MKNFNRQAKRQAARANNSTFNEYSSDYVENSVMCKISDEYRYKFYTIVKNETKERRNEMILKSVAMYEDCKRSFADNFFDGDGFSGDINQMKTHLTNLARCTGIAEACTDICPDMPEKYGFKKDLNYVKHAKIFNDIMCHWLGGY